MAIKKPRPAPPAFEKRAVDMGDLKKELGRRFTRSPLHPEKVPLAVNFGDLKNELGRGK